MPSMRKSHLKTGYYFDCQTCGAEFYRVPHQIKRNPQKFCSLGCRRHTDEAKKKNSESKMGSTPWNKGLTKATDPRVDYHRPTKFKDQNKSPFRMRVRLLNEMRWWREFVFKRDDYTCQSCGTRGGVLHADHVVPLAEIINQNNITTLEAAKNCAELWDTLNGRTLCVSCHRKTDTWGSGTTYYASATGNYAVYA